MENKTVIEHLEHIEDNLKSNSEKITISDMIGEPFDKYFETSTVYYYELDKRRFERHRKKQIKSQIINISFLLLPLIYHLIISIIFKEIVIICYIADLFLISPAIVYLIYALKQKPKKLANSKMNIINHIFYIYDNKLGQERSYGFFKKVMTIYKIICLLLYFSPVLIILYGNNYLSSAGLYYIVYMFSIFLISLYFILTTYKEYNYDAFIFENKDSYVLYDNEIWKKYEK